MNENLSKKLVFATEHRGARLSVERFVTDAGKEGYRMQDNEVIIILGKRMTPDLYHHLVMIMRCNADLLLNQ